MASDRITKRQAAAMERIARGTPLQEVAQEIGVAQKTIQNWMHNKACQEEYRECFKRINIADYARARALLSRQLDNQNPWVAQNAARELLTRTETDALGKEDAAIRVEIVGMPQLGTPDTDDYDNGIGTTD